MFQRVSNVFTAKRMHSTAQGRRAAHPGLSIPHAFDMPKAFHKGRGRPVSYVVVIIVQVSLDQATAPKCGPHWRASCRPSLVSSCCSGSVSSWNRLTSSTFWRN